MRENPLFTKVLIANRGEIALRVARTLREMSIPSVAVYSDADRDARFVLEADEAFRLGPPPAVDSYLNQAALIETALRIGADAIHPGYGFLSENADFAEAVAAAGLTFIGPAPESMRLMGDKIAARKVAIQAAVPVVPGTPGSVTSVDEARAFVAEHGLPVLVKAGGGGGGRGIRVVDKADTLQEALESASREAGTYFNNPDVYLERFYTHARHIEVQVAGDRGGRIEIWGERDCSTQRRRQKLIEETPAPELDEADRRGLFEAARNLAAAASYVGVGTVEFLYAGRGQYFFLEMNTRIQVEHTITEQVTGLDLVRESVRLAAGLDCSPVPESRGHAIEARINAEDPGRGFQPGPGLISSYREPGGPGVRVDSGVYQGFTVPGDYDSLVAKLVVLAPDRQEAVDRMLRALDDYRIAGIPTTIALIRAIVDSEAFRSGTVTTDWLDANLADVVSTEQSPPDAAEPADSAREVTVEVNSKRFTVRIHDTAPANVLEKRSRPRGRRSATVASTNSIVSPMRGTVVTVAKAAGDTVEEGERVIVLEAMKMENEIRAPRAGTVATVHVGIGVTVESGQLLLDLEP